MELCEYCEKEHDGLYGSGRFCSSRCARGYSTKAKRQEINKQVSKTLTGRKIGIRKGFDANKLVLARRNSRVITWISLLDRPWGSLTPKQHRQRILEEQGGLCTLCGIEACWNDLPLVFHLDHVDGDRKNNSRENLRLICPNCHSQTDTYCGKNKFGKPWRKVTNKELLEMLDKEPSISAALRSVGLRPDGNNFSRCYSLLAKRREIE